MSTNGRLLPNSDEERYRSTAKNLNQAFHYRLFFFFLHVLLVLLSSFLYSLSFLAQSLLSLDHTPPVRRPLGGAQEQRDGEEERAMEWGE